MDNIKCIAYTRRINILGPKLGRKNSKTKQNKYTEHYQILSSTKWETTH